MSKQREALKLALEVLEEINKLSIGENAICLPAEIDTAMDAIREALAEQKLEFWPGDVLICKEDDTKVTVVNGNRGSMQLMNGKISIAWSDTVGGEYTIEQIKEMFYRTEDPEPARKPLTNEQISTIVQSMSAYTWDAHMLARAIERAHGIGDV